MKILLLNLTWLCLVSCNSYVVVDRCYISKTEKGTFKLIVNKSYVSNEKDNLEIETSNTKIEYDSINIVLSDANFKLHYRLLNKETEFFEVDDVDALFSTNKYLFIKFFKYGKVICKIRLKRQKKNREKEFISH